MSSSFNIANGFFKIKYAQKADDLLPNMVGINQQWQAPNSSQEKLQLLIDYPALSFMRQALSAHLKSLYSQKKAATDKAQIEKNILKTIADLERVLSSLKYIYSYLLLVPSKKFEIDAHLHLLRQLRMAKPGSPIDIQRIILNFEKSSKETFTRSFRLKFIEVNWWRLFLIRLKRTVDASIPFIKSNEILNCLKQLEKINPAINYLAWLFYLPRLLFNLNLLLVHTFWPRTDEESELGTSLRFKMQWQRRWFEILNDLVWTAVGLINCFLLTSTPAMGLTVALYSFDTIMAICKWQIEMKKINRIEKAIREKIKQLNEAKKGSEVNLTDCEEIAKQISELEAFSTELKAQSHFQNQKLLLSVATTSALFISMGISLFALLFTIPPLAMVGASLVVLTVFLAKFIIDPMINKQKPDDILNQRIDEWASVLEVADNEEKKAQSSAQIDIKPPTFFQPHSPNTAVIPATSKDSTTDSYAKSTKDSAFLS